MSRRLLSILLMLLFVPSVLWALPPPWAQVGGLPACQADLATCVATAQAFPATGQVTCWDGAGNLLNSCAGTEHDGNIQAGAMLAYEVTDKTIIDNNTKLEWMKQDDNNLLGHFACDSLPGSLDKDCRFTWDAAFTFVADLNASEFAGHTDWRVPNVKELQSIVNYENIRPAVSFEAFNTGCVMSCTFETCSCTGTAGYWSSTSAAYDPYAYNPNGAWAVSFLKGLVLLGNKYFAVHVRAVRGGL